MRINNDSWHYRWVQSVVFHMPQTAFGYVSILVGVVIARVTILPLMIAGMVLMPVIVFFDPFKPVLLFEIPLYFAGLLGYCWYGIKAAVHHEEIYEWIVDSEWFGRAEYTNGRDRVI